MRRPVLHCRPSVPSEELRRTCGTIGWPELIILLVVVLIVFGPGKLPDIGNAIGRGMQEFRKASNDLERSIRGEPKASDTTHTSDRQVLTRAPPSSPVPRSPLRE